MKAKYTQRQLDLISRVYDNHLEERRLQELARRAYVRAARANDRFYGENGVYVTKADIRTMLRIRKQGKQPATVFRIKTRNGWAYYDDLADDVMYASGPSAASAMEFSTKRKAENFAKKYDMRHYQIIEGEPI
jgi:hypothetical protein